MKKLSVWMILGLLVSASAWALSPGDVAPPFSAHDQDGRVVKLSDFKGKPVLVYFYPKDESPGCTREACHFRDSYKRFKKLGAVVLGVSRQDAKSHREFRSNHKLPFPLLLDTDGKLAQAYGVGTMPGLGYFKRESVLIGPAGKVVKFYADVNPDTHVPEVLHDLQKLRSVMR